MEPLLVNRIEISKAGLDFTSFLPSFLGYSFYRQSFFQIACCQLFFKQKSKSVQFFQSFLPSFYHLSDFGSLVVSFSNKAKSKEKSKTKAGSFFFTPHAALRAT